MCPQQQQGFGNIWNPKTAEAHMGHCTKDLSPGPGLKCEQTWSCSGEPEGCGGVPISCPLCPKIPLQEGRAAPERLRQLLAGSAAHRALCFIY